MKLVISLVVLLLVTSCGDHLKRIEVYKYYPEENKTYIKLIASVDSSRYKLPIMQMPLYDFHRGVFVGDFETTSDNHIILKLHDSLLPELEFDSEWKLPNNREVPYIIDPKTQVYTFNVGQSKSRVYIALGHKSAVLGMAINMRGLKPSRENEGINILVPYTKNDLSGAIGLYIGTEQDQSGFALFTDISKRLYGSDSGKMTIQNISKRKLRNQLRHYQSTP